MRTGALAWCLSAPPGLADTALPSEADFYADQPIVLSVSRLAQAVSEAPAAVTVIDREMIRASGFRHLADLLRLVPGMEVAWVGGATPTVVYHGLSSIYSRRMQVMVDGRSVYNPAYGQVRWRSLPVDLDDIERIEVVRGPNAANDGVNAFHGTIHIITRPAADSRGLTLAGSVGNHAVGDASLRYGAQAGGWDWRLNLASTGDDMIAALQDDARDNSLALRGDYRPSWRDELNVWLGLSDSDWQVSAPNLPLRDDQRTDFREAYGQLRFRRARNEDSEWSVNLHHTLTQADTRFPLPAGLTAPTDYDYWYRRSALEAVFLDRPYPELRTSLAAEARREQALSRAFLGRDDAVEGTLYRLSGAGEWNFAPRWLLHAGAMLEKHYFTGTRLSPRLALNWQAAPGHNLRLAVSHGHRPPTFVEAGSDLKLLGPGGILVSQVLLSPPGLRPETITSTELGYVFQTPDQGLRGDLRLFQNRSRNLIDGDPAQLPAIHFQNLYTANQVGLEGQLRWQPAPHTWVVLNQSFTRTDSNSAEYTHAGADNITSLLLSHTPAPGWQASLGYYHQGRVTWQPPSRASAPYDRLDLRLARAWKGSAGQRGEVALVGQNLLGGYDEYADVPYQVEPGAYLTLRLSLD
jgi:iron complex outermembrane receptor protein